VNLSFIISGHRKWPHLAITSINGLEMDNKSQKILHHLGTQNDAKLCLKMHQTTFGGGQASP